MLTEDHAFWIDFRWMYQVRRVYLELGRRLAAGGALDRADDVFLLTPERGAGHGRGPAPARPPAPGRGAPGGDGLLPHDRPPAGAGHPARRPAAHRPAQRGHRQVLRRPPPAPDAAAEPGVLRGTPGSPGTARGPARVVRSLAEAGRLRPGDVLVAETTAPPWTPLFATAAAIVTDTGGVLSHCAVVAREYGLPAVVGTGAATASIEDGQLVEVDGDAGLVRLL